MAKAAKVAKVSVNMNLLAAIGAGQVTHVTQAEAVEAGLNHDPALVEVNTAADAIVDGKAPVRLSPAGTAMVANGAAQSTAPAAASAFTLISGAVLPPSKRKGGGGSGAPKKYPFDQMEVGHTFFVAASDENPDPVKKLGSTVSSVNMRYSVVEKNADGTNKTKQVERTVRGPGNKAVQNPDGTNKREIKTVDVYKQTRKYVIRPVVKGETYGTWVADANGALIGRMA